MGDYSGLSQSNCVDWGISIKLAKPTLILGAGIGGSGKSTLLKPLTRSIENGVYLDKDMISCSFMWMPRAGERSDVTRYLLHDPIPISYSNPNQSKSNNYYRDHVCLQAYHCLLMLGRQMLSLGKHPILDGNYIKEIRWGYIEKVIMPQLECVEHKLKIILAHAPADLIRKRLFDRAADHDKFKISSDVEWQKLLDEQPPVPPEIERYPHIKVDTSRPINYETIQEIVAFLQD